MEPMQEAAQETTSQDKPSIVDRGKDTAVRGYRSAERRVRNRPRKYAIWTGAILLFVVSFIPALRVPPPHVALSGEPINPNFPWLTNTILTTIVVDIVIIILALLATRGMKAVPGRWQNFVEMMVEYLYGLAESIAGRDARRYFPWVVTIFIFVIMSNWIGLIPGVGSIVVHQPATAGEEHAATYDSQLAMADGNLVLAGVQEEGGEGEEGEAHGKEVPLFRAPSADLNTTFALSLFTMLMVQIWGVRALGMGYFKKFFTFKGPNISMKLISAFVGILELISEFSRLLAFGFRLFGNIFAGEIVLATMAFLIAYWLPVPFYMLEVFVGFVQALVFMMLALVFWTMATMSHEHDH